jgi:hypothetical protein
MHNSAVVDQAVYLFLSDAENRLVVSFWGCDETDFCDTLVLLAVSITIYHVRNGGLLVSSAVFHVVGHVIVNVADGGSAIQTLQSAFSAFAIAHFVGNFQ